MKSVDVRVRLCDRRRSIVPKISFRFLAGRLPVKRNRQTERERDTHVKEEWDARARHHGRRAADEDDKGVTAVKQTAACQPKERKDDEASERAVRDSGERHQWKWTAQLPEMQ